MSVDEPRRFRLSIRSLMYAVAISAVVLAPMAWLLQRAELQRRVAQMAFRDAERARALGAQAQAQALRAMYATRIQAEMNVGGSSPAAPRRASLWAALRVNHPVVRLAEAKDLDIEFALVNDGNTVVDPRLAESRIVINGEELDDSALILGNGPRDARASALAPGDDLRFAFPLGAYFKEPGNYRVSWHGASFDSPELEFRVLPDGRSRTPAATPGGAPK